MSKNITLTATSDYDTAGKQHIGKATGPDPRWGVALAFVGTVTGKRRDVTTETVTEPGLYRVRDTTRKGTDDTWWIVWEYASGDLRKTAIDAGDAKRLAKSLTIHSINAAGREAEIAEIADLVASGEKKDPDGTVEVSAYCRARLGWTDDGPRSVRRADLLDARRKYLASLRGTAPATDVAALESERAQLVARLAEIDAEIARARGDK